MTKNINDIIIIGAGIVGLSTAYNLLIKNPKLKISLLEKEDHEAKHQTGNNSGVIHSGIYYKPGSQKALNCINGYYKLLNFCNEYDIKYEICGKVIVQTKESQEKILHDIFERGKQNGLEGLRLLTQSEVKEIEPHVACIKGIYVPQTGIIDYKQVCSVLKKLIIEMGCEIHFNTKVLNIKSSNNETIIQTNNGDFNTNYYINCAGLYSDKITKMAMPKEDIMIIPFRGEYYEVNKDKRYLVKNLIYPVPNPSFPFLGVHFTRMINGHVEAGPNAVLAFKREGYKKSDINFKELMEVLFYKGFRKIASKYWEEGWMELKRSYSKKLFVKAMQELIPEIQESDVHRGGSGVRAQACDSEVGLLDDFKIYQNSNSVNVFNAPSPAATSGLSVGEKIAKLYLSNV